MDKWHESWNYEGIQSKEYIDKNLHRWYNHGENINERVVKIQRNRFTKGMKIFSD